MIVEELKKRLNHNASTRGALSNQYPPSTSGPGSVRGSVFNQAMKTESQKIIEESAKVIKNYK